MSKIKCICTSSLTTDTGVLEINIPDPCTPFQNGDVVKVEICSRIPADILPTASVRLVIGETSLAVLDKCINLVQVQQLSCGKSYCFCINTEFTVTSILNCLPEVCRILPTIPPTPTRAKTLKKDKTLQ